MSSPHASSVDTELSDLVALFELDELAPLQFRNRRHEGNLNGRGHAFGGQLLGQALVAASRTVTNRVPTSLQLQFLKGTDVQQPIDYDVTSFHDGRRFSNRQVHGRQGSSATIEAQISFQIPQVSSWEHSAPMTIRAPTPESLPSFSELNTIHRERLAQLDYALFERPCVEFKLMDADQHLFKPNENPTMNWWIKLRQRLPGDPLIHAAALAYLSDWWISSTVLTAHLPIVGTLDRVYLASLNHSLWLHAPVVADDWLLFVTQSPHAGFGMGLSTGNIYDRAGRLVASVAQQSSAMARPASTPAAPVPASR